jgi:hypothetical protein
VHDSDATRTSATPPEFTRTLHDLAAEDRRGLLDGSLSEQRVAFRWIELAEQLYEAGEKLLLALEGSALASPRMFGTGVEQAFLEFNEVFDRER